MSMKAQSGEKQIPRSAWNDTTAEVGVQSSVKRAFFRGERLHMGDEEYRAAVIALLDPLQHSDAGHGDLTASALGLAEGQAGGKVLAKESGVVAGLEELEWLLKREGLAVQLLKQDGETIERGEVLAEITGRRGDLLVQERTGLNLLQRMSGIATMTRRLQDQMRRGNSRTVLIATRKTPWGLLDKRSVSLGGGGTHRLGLSDAILVKNNHLALLAAREEDAVVTAVERAWAGRQSAVFVEIEVRSAESAVATAQAFRRVRAGDPASCPCVLLLDNMSPEQALGTMDVLKAEGLREEVLVEISGAISESNLDEYASSGADALSMGALTHSPRALDLSFRIS
jgi:nicotinate-nucleotide pyrophosphorylase (carboxylating)